LPVWKINSITDSGEHPLPCGKIAAPSYDINYLKA
jgi:hypothetical protein